METITDSPHRRKSNRKSWIDQSPIDPVTDIAREETLLLTHFTKKPTICFGKVKIGKTLHRKLYVSNPHDYDQCVVIEKFPHEANFAIDQKEFVVPGESTLTLNLTWTPENEGGCRQMISFLVDDSYRLQAVLYGTAEVPRQKKVAKRGIMSKSVKKPFSILHTPNLANLKTYSNSMERETVSETSSVRRALLNSKSKSNQENRQPVTKKSPLVTVKSPPRVHNGISENQNLHEEFENWGDSKSKSAHLETKVRSSVKELYHISRPKDNSTEIVSCVSYEDTIEQVTKTNALKVNQWKALEKAYQIESMDNVAEMQTFDYALCKKQKQCQKQSVAALYPRRETYLVKKHMSQQRRSWKNWNLSPSAQAPIPDGVNVTQPCLSSLMLDADELNKTASATTVFTSSPNFMTSSPVEKCSLRNKIVQSGESSKRTGLNLNHNDFSACNSRERLDKIEASPKSDDGMSTDSLNSKNSSTSSVEALLTGKRDPAPEKVLKTSTTMTFDFRKATPSLPDKLNPQNGRRSTHVVKEPKIVCGQGKLKQKQLFSAGHESLSCQDLSYIRPIDDVKVPPGSHKTQVKKPPTARNSVSSRVRAAQKAVRVTNREQLSQSLHERLSNSHKSTASEKSKSILTRSARSTVSSVKKTEIAKSRKSYLSPKKCGVAQSRLVLGKREKTVIPKHPMPFASKNIYYDERWMQKQEWSFTHWFNFILTPVEDYKLRNCPRVDAGSLVFNCKQDYHLAPSKEVLSFEAYAARRRLNRLRKLACQMFQSADIVRIVRKVEVEIDSQRLVVRKDRPIHADIGLKQNILNWILSYNPLWLRIGLEMVFGEVLLIESNTDILGLSKFIITRLVGNPDIASQFAHPSVPHLYRDGYQTALAKHTLKKFLILVYFLDYAKRHRLIEHDPCLFCKDSEIKASRDFLLNISRDFLSGEGDVTRHLAYLGYVVSYVQTPLDEFDYAVTNLAIDLRNGVRLTRVVEILTGKWGLTKSLRAPAISRLQKIHNVELVLKALSDHGMSLDTEKGEICAKDIVDGHREKSLTLLWRVVTGFQVDILLDVKELEDEIACLNRSLKRKMAIWKSAGVKSTFELNNRRSSVDLKKFENSKHSLLFDWCQAVCSHYGLKIENFTVSFSDGRVLCYLIHHYYPGLLPLSEIKQETTFTYINECENQQEDSDNSFDLMASSLHCCPRTGKPKIYQELLANEAENFKLIAVKVSQIGGVPTMLRHSDMSNTIPDEKVVITYVTYLAIRLLEIRHESRAAIIIQLAWRKYQLRKKQMLLKLKSKGPTLIPDNDQILQPQFQTPDQSSPKQESISIKNAVIPLSENSDSHNLGHSINDYSPIRPVDREPLAVSSKKGKVLDPILESSAIESCISYKCDSQVVIEPFLVGDKNISLRDDAGVGQKLNKTINLSDSSLIRSDERSAANLKSSSRAGDASLNRPCSDISAKSLVDNLTDSKGASSQLNTTMDLKDQSPLLRCDLPEVCIDLCNETFNSENCSQRPEAQPDLLTIDNSRVGINQTFDGEACVQRSTPDSKIPSVDAKQIQNETFEKICSQRCALNSAQRNRKQSIQNETFETSLPRETDLLNSPVIKVKCDVQGNETFDRDLSKPELQNVLSGSHGYAVQGNKMTLAFTDSENSSIPGFEDQINTNGTFEGEVQKRNAKTDTAEFVRSHHQTEDSHSEENSHKNESLCEVEENQCLKRQHSQNKQTNPDDCCRSFVCEETMEQPLMLNQTVEIDSRCQGSFSMEPATVVMAFDHDQLHGNGGQQPSEIENQIFDSYEKDNTINLELNKTTEYDSAEAEKLQSRAAAELQSKEAFECADVAEMQSGDAVDLQSGDVAEMQSNEVAELQSGDAVDLQSGEELQSGDAVNLQSKEILQSGDVAELQSGDVAGMQSNVVVELQSGDAVNLQSNEILQSGDVAELQSVDVAELQSVDVAELQSVDVAELQSGDVAELQSGDVAELQSGDVAELQSGDVAELQSGDVAELQSGDVAGMQSNVVVELQSGDAVNLQCKEILQSNVVVELQSGDAVDLQSGEELQSGDTVDLQSGEELQSGDVAELQSGDVAELQSGDVAGMQSNVVVELQSGDAVNLQSGDVAELQSGDAAELQSEEVLQSGDAAELQFEEALQSGDAAEMQSGEAGELWSHEDLFNDSYVCQVHNNSVSFSKMNKTVEIENSYDGSTTLAMQNSENGSHVRSCSDVLHEIVDKSKCEDVISDSQLQQSSFEESEEEWIEEEFILKMSRARTTEMIVDRESPHPSAKQTDFLANKAALVIQNAFHRYATRKHFLRLRNSTIAIQRWYRYIRKMKKAQQEFQNMKAATLVIQSTVRAHLIRKKFMMQKQCLISLQQRRKGLVLMRNTRTEYLAKRAAIKSIQRWYRAVTEMKKVKTDYKNTRNAAIKIQRWHRAITEMKLAKTNYENTRKSVVKIQRWHRATTEMKKAKTNYENTRKAAFKIQRWHRAITEMKKAKTNYENTRKAAIKIQRWHRAVTEMKQSKTDYENTRKATIKIQRWHRAITEMRKAKNDFENSRNAAIKIQRWHRAITEMKKAKTDYENTRKAVIKIQSLVRQRNQQREFLRKKNAFLCIQRWFRSVLRMKEERCKYVCLKKAVIRIQANFRGYKQRKAYLLQQESALKIQSLFRKFLARRRFLCYRNSAITIQQHYRSTMAMRKARKDFESLKAATLVIQSTVKAYQERKRFLQKKKSVLVLQERRRAILSMRIARTEYLAKKGASKLIQRWYRGVKEMHKVRGDFKKTKNAAVKLQSLVRMRNQRKEFLRKKSSAICIQKWYRSVRMMQEARTNYNSVRRAAIQIQAFFRAHMQRKQFLLKKSALRIQEWYRSTCRMRSARTSYLLMRSSVIKCQSQVRMLLARQHFLEQKRCAIVIQKWYCSRKLMEKEMNAYQSKKLAAVKLQSAFRSYLQRKIYLEERRCIISAQSVVRMWIARCRWLSMKRAAILIQRKYRSRLALRHLRETIMKRHEAATRIQLWFRKQLILRRQRGVLKINCDCCSADSLMKNKKYADIWLDKLQRKLNAVCLLQKYWRAWLCRKHSAIKIQSVVRGWFVRRWLAQQTSAAVLIQSLWRGYKVRCSARRPITDLRKRLEDVTKKATDDKKLSNRFASGFNHLMKYKQISEILQALVNLEVASRLSPVCCVQLAEGNAAPVILTIIRGCNRSVPHIEIIKYCIQILLNLAKYAPTIEAVYDSHPDAIDIILNVLMIFREKGLVFAKSCILLAIIALDMHEKGELDALLTKPQFQEKILSLYKLTSRKYKLEETRVTTRARMMAVKDSAVFREISMTADMAKIGPDWLLGKKILREIKEPLKAMTYLLNCLGLHHVVMNTQSKLHGKTHK